MDKRYTPGPWKPCRAHEDQNGPLWPLDDEERADLERRRYTQIIAANGETVAAAHDLFEFTEANAHLIAAAPQMLEELEADLAMLIELRDKHLAHAAAVVRALVQKRIDATAGAIAKAKGEV